MFNMLWAAALVIATRSVAADVVPASVTFHKDVLPILQKNCLAEELPDLPPPWRGRAHVVSHI